MFVINSNTAKQLKTGDIRPDQLVLHQTTTSEGRIWELCAKSDLSEISEIADKILAEGSEIEEILKKVANGEALPEKFAELSKNQKFRVLSRSIPGMETPEHRKGVKEGLQEKIERVKQTLQIIGEGTKELKQKGKPWRLVDTHYVLSEVVIKDHSISIEAAKKLESMWLDSDTTLNYADWLKKEKNEWSKSKTEQEFLSWITNKQWGLREKKAWETLHPNEQFTEEKFANWKKTQFDPNSLLPEPKWLLKSYWEKDNEERLRNKEPEIGFEDWIKETLEGRKKWWSEELKKNEGLLPFKELDDDTFKFLDRKIFEYDHMSGSSLSPQVWIAKELWKETKPTALTDQAFIDHIERRQFEFSHPKESTSSLSPSFEDWKKTRDQNLIDRWKKSNNALPFEQWKSHQVFNPLVPMPFVSLDKKQREAYRTECNHGCLIRGHQPFATAEESTAHSGKGWVIFVIGPKDNLYCGSHLPGVFHHSSFLGDAAVMSAGEIKTDENGKITHISSKSGHYKPTARENREMLEWFKVHNVDLKEVTFTCFLPGGKESQPINAQEYLDGKEPLPKD